MAPMTKVGLDDYLASGKSLVDLKRCIVDRLPDQPAAAPLPPAPTWPAGIFPAAVDAYGMAQARAINVPPEMVFVPLLVFAGSTIGNAVELQLKRAWTVPPTLWAGLIGDPGKKKTPALKAALWVINALQKRYYERYLQAMAEHQDDLSRWEARPKGERGEKPQPPKLDHLYTTDITLEALVTYLDYCSGLAIIRDELSGFIGAMDKYRGKGDDRQQYLSLWAFAPIKTDRKGGGTLLATRPVAGVYGGIQPDYARDLHTGSGARDGMVERFCLYRPDVPPNRWTDDDVDPALLDPVVDLFHALRAGRNGTREGVVDEQERVTVRLHPDARELFVAWYDANGEAAECTTGLRHGFYSKLDSQVARIALILHCLHHADDPRVMLSADTMRAAIDVGEYFRAHLDRVLPLIGDSSTGEPVGLAARILAYLRRDDLQDADGWVRRGELLHRLSNVPAEALTAELGRLHDRGAAERRTVASGTKPAEEWRIVTAAHATNRNNPNNPEPNGTAPQDCSDSSDRLYRDTAGLTPAGPDLDHCRQCGGPLPDDRDALRPAPWEEDADRAFAGFMPMEGSI